MDKNKVLWHTIKLRIPSEMISIGKNGVMTVKQSLTKKNNIAKRLKEPSVIVEADPNITEAKIIDKGDVENVDDIKVRQGKLKTIRKKIEALPNKPATTKAEFVEIVKQKVATGVQQKKTMKEILVEIAKRKKEEKKEPPKTEAEKKAEFIERYKEYIKDLSSKYPFDEDDLNKAVLALYRLRNNPNITDDKIRQWGNKYRLLVNRHTHIDKEGMERRRKELISLKKVFFLPIFDNKPQPKNDPPKAPIIDDIPEPVKEPMKTKRVSNPPKQKEAPIRNYHKNIRDTFQYRKFISPLFRKFTKEEQEDYDDYMRRKDIYESEYKR